MKRLTSMKRLTNKNIFRILFFLIVSNTGCSYDNIEEKYNRDSCDLSNVSWNDDVSPIINNFCVGCHQGSSPSAGLDLSSYSGVKSSVDQETFSIRVNMARSNPLKMPPNAVLDSCIIEQINIWIANGAPEN